MEYHNLLAYIDEYISFDDEKVEILKSRSVNAFFRLIIQNIFVASQKQIIPSYSKDAGKRYIEFQNRYPNLGSMPEVAR